MSFQPKRLDVLCLTKVIKQELQEQEPKMEYLEDLLNRLSPVTKQLALEILLNDSSLNDNQLLNCLNLLLDKTTKHFNLIRKLKCHNTIISIMQMITKLSPNIETIDFSEILFESEFEDEFIIFLKNCNNLKALRLMCSVDNCVPSKLLMGDKFAKLDENVRNKLEKIDYLNFSNDMEPEDFNKILNRLPNLKSFVVTRFSLGYLLSDYFKTCKSHSRTFDMTEIYDMTTSLQTLENFAKCFPKATDITLILPKKNVVENLWKLPFITKLSLYSFDGFDGEELLKFLYLCGKNIKTMKLIYSKTCIIDNTFYDLCPNLVELTNVHN